MLKPRWIAVSALLFSFPASAQEAVVEKTEVRWPEVRHVTTVLREKNDVTYKVDKTERDKQEETIEGFQKAFDVPSDARGANITVDAKKGEFTKRAGEQVNDRWFAERKLDETLKKLAESKSIAGNIARDILDRRAVGKVQAPVILEEKVYAPLASINDKLVDLLGGVKSPYADRDKQFEGLLNSCPTPEATRELLAELRAREAEFSLLNQQKNTYGERVAKYEKDAGHQALVREYEVLLDKPNKTAEELARLDKGRESKKHEEYARVFLQAAVVQLKSLRSTAAEITALKTALELCEKLETAAGEVNDVDLMIADARSTDSVLKEAVDAFRALDDSHKKGREALTPVKAAK